CAKRGSIKWNVSGGGATLLVGSRLRTDVAKEGTSSLGRSGLRRYVHAITHSIVRRLIRTAPNLLSFGAGVVQDELARAPCDRAFEVEGRIANGDWRFTLLRPDFFRSTRCAMILQWGDYLNLRKRGEVYDPTMLACLTRLLQGTARPRFMDIGAFLGYYACYA